MTTPLPFELGRRQHEQHVTGAQRHGAELAGEIIVVALDRQDGCVVARPEPDVVQGAAGQLRPLGDDDLVQAGVGAIARTFEVGLFGALQSRGLQQVDDIVDVAGEVADVARAEQCLGPGRDDMAATFDPGEEHAMERSEPCVVDRLPDDRTIRLDPQRERVRVGGLQTFTPGCGPVAEQPGRGHHEHEHSDQGDGQPDRRDLEDAQRITPAGDEQIGHDQVRRRSDHRHDATEHRRVRQRHEVGRRRHAVPTRPRDHPWRCQRDERRIR